MPVLISCGINLLTWYGYYIMVTLVNFCTVNSLLYPFLVGFGARFTYLHNNVRFIYTQVSINWCSSSYVAIRNSPGCQRWQCITPIDLICTTAYQARLVSHGYFGSITSRQSWPYKLIYSQRRTRTDDDVSSVSQSNPLEQRLRESPKFC